MRFIGKPEVLSDTFLTQTAGGSRKGAVLTDEDVQSLLPTTLVLEPGEARLGLFAIRLDQFDLSEMKKLRKVFPRFEYTLMKNKLRARNTRKMKRNNLRDLMASNAALKAENKKLKKLLRCNLQKLSILGKNDAV